MFLYFHVMNVAKLLFNVALKKLYMLMINILVHHLVLQVEECPISFSHNIENN